MRTIKFYILVWCVAVSLGLLTPRSSLLGEQDKQVFVHYMPWYASKPISGTWGWHWTMNKFMPEKKPLELASHFVPQIGPYDSFDAHAIEYHVQLMKLSGINGVIIDWYGVSEFRDYAMIHRNTKALINVIRQAGLKYGICYEDQTIKHRIEQKQIRPEQSLEYAQKDFMWLKTNCFVDSSYLKISDRPVLLVFGPQHLKAKSWQQLKQNTAVELFALPHLSQDAQFDGAFGWPPVHGGETINRQTWEGYLDILESRSSKEKIISIAFPGFKDIYSQANIGPSYGFIDSEKGNTFKSTFDRAQKDSSLLIQIATWNDFGEGTNIEPTHEYGLVYLEYIQKQTDSHHDFQPEDLKIPLKLYQLRKSHFKDPLKKHLFDSSSQNLLNGRVDSVRAAIAGEKE